MSRYCGEKETKPILDAAEHWKNACLLGTGSVLSDGEIWSIEYLDALDRHYVAQPDLGEGAFINKLEHQLGPAPLAAKRLAAEMMWLLYLCPSSITIRHKRKVVDTVWSWSGTNRPETAWMSDAVLAGIGSGGPGFNQYLWRELSFLIKFMRAFRDLARDEASRLLEDGWTFSDWLRQVPEWDARQFRHMLLFLLFPDDFERIFGQRDRRAVVQVFGGDNPSAVNSMDPAELDRAIREARRKLELEYGTTQLDFYVPPLRDRWKEVDFTSVAATMTADHVRMALQEIDREGVPASAQSTGYDLIEAGQRYPPKLVFSLAARYATGQELDRNLFSGGDESPAFKVLKKLGFEISSKDLITPLVSKFIDQAKAGTDLRVGGYVEEYRGLQVRVSFGQGNFARVPWIAFLGADQSVQSGIYPVLLFFKEKNALLLCYGVSETNPPQDSWSDAPGDAKTVSTWFREQYGREPERYGDSLVRKPYDTSEPLPYEEIRSELDVIIGQYEEVLGAGARLPEPEDVREDVAATCSEFGSALRASNIDFGDHHYETIAAFISALASKPLVILTGLSGSGKTQIAVRFGEWLGKGRLHVAAVRPDWTGAEALFGYEDGLKPSIDGRSAWAVPVAFEFMLSAASDPSNPYLLLLDEMNLAHVERYFADVLSGMESGQPCLPNLVKGADGMWRVRAQGPDRIPLPRNIWIVGTVNVDETTYMFSPKVLDRANTFEFRVATEHIGNNYRKPIACVPGDPSLVRGLLKISRNDAWHIYNPAPYQAELEGGLRRLHTLLSRFGLEFGHRVFYEALRFAALASKANIGTAEKALDRVVVQKILPRLHGSRRRLETPILALMQFCYELPPEVSSDGQLQALELEQRQLSQAKLPLSYDKLGRMLRSLRANQFASFTE